MRARAGRQSLALLLVAGLWLAQAGLAAAMLGWSQSASPGSAKVGQPTVFTLRVSNDNLLPILGVDSIGCVRVTVGAAFVIESVGIVAAPSGRTWLPSHSGGVATVRSDSGGGRLDVGQSVTFTITAVPLQVGSHTWTTRVIRDQDCGGGAVAGSESHSVSVTQAPTPTPTPTPTPSPTPKPTPKPTSKPTPTPTPTPTPILPLPTLPLPTLPTNTPPPPTPPPGPDDPSPSPSPTGAPTPRVGPSPSPEPDDAGGVTGPRAGGADGGGLAAVLGGEVAPQPDAGAGAPSGGGAAGGVPDFVVGSAAAGEEAGGFGLHLNAIGLLADPVWVIPAASIAGPGLLVLLWLALQALGAAAWIPAVRRLRGEGRRR